jgi:SAM-dependent methyltransferase
VSDPVPAAWLIAHADRLPRGAALDLACGRGRHALWLAEQGWQVTAVDRDAEALGVLEDDARRRRLPIVTERIDLETGSEVLPVEAFDAIVVVHYLHRPLFPQIVRALRPSGVLVYETFTTAQAARGKPTNPAFLLRPGELRQLVRPLETLVWREGQFDGRAVASVVARRV